MTRQLTFFIAFRIHEMSNVCHPPFVFIQLGIFFRRRKITSFIQSAPILHIYTVQYITQPSRNTWKEFHNRQCIVMPQNSISYCTIILSGVVDREIADWPCIFSCKINLTALNAIHIIALVYKSGIFNFCTSLSIVEQFFK